MSTPTLSDAQLADMLWNVEHAPTTEHLLAWLAVLHPHHRHDARWRDVLLSARERVVQLN